MNASETYWLAGFRPAMTTTAVLLLLFNVSLCVADEPTTGGAGSPVAKSTRQGFSTSDETDDQLTPEQLAVVQSFQRRRVAAIEQVIGSVVAIYDDDRQGGGSGVIIDPTGIALTNHHVILGSGVTGWGGLADGNLYRWELIGTDIGGDVAVIQLKPNKAGQPFPFTPLGDSDKVRVGDWALAMGNPFILTEDQKPTVTLGIVSGVKRYQPGAGDNQLVYGNCIQVDSSINPGNSGGPLFNLDGRVIGINGRGSFQDRGRVNVGLGYAISANQIKNFIPELLATKLVEHATLDVQFEDRGGKVICSRRNRDSPAAQAGVELGDELLTFERQAIKNANQFTNLICTLPEDWPIHLVIQKPDGSKKSIFTRALGLPYRKPPRPRPIPNPTPQQQKAIAKQMAMVKLLSATPNTVRLPATNRRYARQLIAQAQHAIVANRWTVQGMSDISGTIYRKQQPAGSFRLRVNSTGELRMHWDLDRGLKLQFDGKNVTYDSGQGPVAQSLADLVRSPAGLYLYGISNFLNSESLSDFSSAMIDGSDKVAHQNAWRMRGDGASLNPFYIWLTMYGDSGLPQPRLTKIARDRDCREGGLVFDPPQNIDGFWLPQTSRLVSGIAETEVLRIVIDAVDPVLQTVDPPSAEEPN